MKRRKGGAVASEGELVDAVETLQWPKVFFLALRLPNEEVCTRDKCQSVTGFEPTHHSFRVASHREIWRYNQLTNPMLKRHMFSLRDETLNLCGVHAEAGRDGIYRGE